MTWVVKRKVSKGEVAARVKNIFGRCIRNRECPKALGVYRPFNTISLRPSFFIQLRSRVVVTQVSLSILSCCQHHEGIYWCPAPLRNEEERNYKVCAAPDV
jgi:hypothetical protein